MEVSGQLHIPVALTTLTHCKAGVWGPEALWKLWNGEKPFPPAKNRTPVVQSVTGRYTDWATPGLPPTVHKLLSRDMVSEWAMEQYEIRRKLSWFRRTAGFILQATAIWPSGIVSVLIRVEPVCVCVCVSWLGKLFGLLAYHSEPLLSWGSDQVQLLFRQQMPRGRKAVKIQSWHLPTGIDGSHCKPQANHHLNSIHGSTELARKVAVWPHVMSSVTPHTMHASSAT
jgi:hypothetical protein